jgi:hypothetical protein
MGDLTFEIRLGGFVSPEDLCELDRVRVTERQVSTVLSGTFADEAELCGLLHRLRDWGLELIEVRRVEPPDVGNRSTPR